VEKYNNLTLLKLTEPIIRASGSLRKMGLFRCDCGNESIKAYDAVKCGGIKSCKSCGIIRRAISKSTHGGCKHPLYAKYRDMINRCENVKRERYSVYGARGIKVCKEWRENFKVFFDWCIINGYEKHLQIDRKDVNGNYCPENCRFITAQEQNFNRQNTFYVEVEGVKYCLVEVLYKNNMVNKYSNIWHGIKKGKTIDFYIKKYGIVFCKA
jgi:hypothetical protein